MKLKAMAVEPPLPKPDTRDPRLLAASRMYEKQFLGEMVREMRKTVNDSGLIKVGMGEKIFREQLDDQYVDVWGDHGGIGLADLIYNQVMERFGANVAQGQRQHSIKDGMFPITPASVDKVLKRRNSKSGEIQLKVLNHQKSAQLKAPWSGKIIAQGQLEDGRSFVKIGHDNGLVSQFVYHGHLSGAQLGSSVEKGQPIGLVSSDLVWNLSSPDFHPDKA